ncbi:MAG: hypothetical protein EZS28_022576 [Streblomastix strix]|uniref:SPRY domain-containing protein n=1 Tax=Streblomastix strix TaxID=222440 RepID=A0A5J4VHQ5_9EUKA|nr:MAG: hypothetical protein EZS28_022576 [Streblomastix strix]
MSTPYSDPDFQFDTVITPSKNIKDEIHQIVNEIQSDNIDLHADATQKLTLIVLNECPQQSSMLLLYPLVTLLQCGNKETSDIAQNELSVLIKNSDDIRDSLLKIGFLETARISLTDENTPNHIESNVLDVIQSLLFQGVNANEMIGLVSILSQLSEEKSEEKKKISQKAKMIHTLLLSQGVNGPSEQLISKLENQNEVHKREIEEMKNQIKDLENTLKAQKSIDIILSISAPSGKYTKKEGEFTYTSTQTGDKTFPIDYIISKGIYRCEFKINQIKGFMFFGIKKSTLAILFTQSHSGNPYGKEYMYFRHEGEVKFNGNKITGNQRFKSGDIISLEVNMNIVPRTVRLFINGVLQPVYMSGIPDSIQFYFTLYCKDDSITVLSLKRISSPTDATVIGAKEVKWE